MRYIAGNVENSDTNATGNLEQVACPREFKLTITN